MKRILSLDVMRGMSICGILFMNILGFHYLQVYYEPYVYYEDRLSRWLYKLNEVFIFNSFYPIFAFLFGVGLAIMFQNTQMRHEKSLFIMYRRIFAMMIFGALHGYFLFYGDIMNVYAVMALFAIPLLFAPNMLSIIIMICTALFNFLAFIAVYLMPETDNGTITGADESVLYKAIQDGNIKQIIHQNMLEFNASNAFTFVGIVGSVLSVLPFILLGMVIFRSGLLMKILEKQRMSLYIAIVATAVGLLLKFYAVKAHISITQAQVFIYYGGSVLSVGYFIFVTLMCENVRLQKILQPFRNMGKLSFTLYIMQSIIMFLMFYICKGYDRLPIDLLYLFAILIILMQMVFSHFYLQRFKMGPLEFVWRKITYLK